MTLLLILLILSSERIFKQSDRWQIDRYLFGVFPKLKWASLAQTLLLTALVVIVSTLLYTLVKDGLHRVLPGETFWSLFLFGLLILALCMSVGLLCIGAGRLRRVYREYISAVKQGDEVAATEMAKQFVLPQHLEAEGEALYLQEIQNALLWINYRYYFAPLFWFIISAKTGVAFLLGYVFLRAYQSWLAQNENTIFQTQTGVDWLLRWLDWVPVRLIGLIYALIGHGEKALPAWLVSLSDIRSSPHQVLTRLAQFSLAREPHQDMLNAPQFAVKMAREVMMVVVFIVAILTIFGSLF